MNNPILFLIGDHPRNLHLINTILEESPLVKDACVILQKRKKLIPQTNSDWSDDFKNLHNLHFKKREKSELNFFDKNYIPKNVEILNVDLDSLNSKEVINFIKSRKFRFCFSFGVGVIRSELLNSLPELSINIHTGITPRYKGDACNFWPFYFFEPNWAGVTFHKLTKKIDDGNILHQLTPKLEYDDGLHDVSSKAVLQASLDAIEIINYFHKSKEVNFIKSKNEGRYFRARDFSPINLKTIYEFYNDKIVNLFLDEKIRPIEVSLIKLI